MLNARLLVSTLAIALLAGCSSAQKSSEVAACYVPSYSYNNFSCDQLINEAENLRARTPALAAAVDAHRKNQTGGPQWWSPPLDEPCGSRSVTGNREIPAFQARVSHWLRSYRNSH